MSANQPEAAAGSAPNLLPGNNLVQMMDQVIGRPLARMPVVHREERYPSVLSIPVWNRSQTKEGVTKHTQSSTGHSLLRRGAGMNDPYPVFLVFSTALNERETIQRTTAWKSEVSKSHIPV